MKTKIGISLLACTLILSSSPLPLILADELNDSNTETEVITSDSQTTLPEEDETLTNQEGSKNTQASTQSTTPPPTLPSESDSVEETVASETPEEEMITQEVYGDYELNELLQQEQRDAAMAMMDSAPTENRSRQKRSAMTYASNPQADFINAVAPGAVALAGKYNLYASVMIAQAILESGWGTSTLSLPPNHNLFGIKGDHKGQSVTMKTWEVVNGQKIWINAKFRKYPNYQASLEDNAKLLRYGPDFSSSFYNGAWKENTKSYQDATAWLTGRYATDPDYASKLNATIAANQLTKYDYPQTNPNNQRVTKYTAQNKGMKIAKNSFYIYTAPFNTSGSYRIGQIKDHYEIGKRVTVSNYATTSQGVKTYYVDNLGWIDQGALVDYPTYKKTAVNRTMRINKNSFYIYNLPYNTDGAKKTVRLSNNYSINNQVKITAEATTSEGIQVKYIQNVGWVDHRAFAELATKTKETVMKKPVPKRILKNTFYLYSEPFNTLGSTRLARVSDKLALNDEVAVTKYVLTSQNVKTYYLDGYGWVDENALKDPAKISESKKVKLPMRVKTNSYYFYSNPFNTAGAKKKFRVREKLAINDPVTVTEEATTNEGIKTYYIKNYGWVDHNALKPEAKILSSKNLKKSMRVNKNSYYFYSEPFNTAGSKKNYRVREKLGANSLVSVLKEASTSEGIKTYFVEGHGWVDHNGLKEVATVTSQSNVNIPMRIKVNSYYFYSDPFNTIKSEKKNRVREIFVINAPVTATKYAVTSEGIKTYFIDGYGWVDHNAVESR